MNSPDIEKVVQCAVDGTIAPIQKRIKRLEERLERCKELLKVMNVIMFLITVFYNLLITENLVTDDQTRSIVYLLYIFCVLSGFCCYVFLNKELREENHEEKQCRSSNRHAERRKEKSLEGASTESNQ